MGIRDCFVVSLLAMTVGEFVIARLPEGKPRNLFFMKDSLIVIAGIGKVFEMEEG
jgi:hypothetical protein